MNTFEDGGRMQTRNVAVSIQFKHCKSRRFSLHFILALCSSAAPAGLGFWANIRNLMLA
jgi:hypothetical protein